MFRRRLRLVLVVCFGLLLVKLLLSVSVGRISLSRQTANGRPEGDNGSPSSHFDPDEFVQGLAEPRLFFEGLGTLASEALPSQIGDRLLEQLRSLSRLEEAKRRLGARLTSLPRLVPHFDDKLILATAGVGVDRRLLKREAFIADRCPINNCYLMDDLTELPPGVRRPDVVLYRTRTSQLNTLSEQRTKDEIWITWQLECPISAPMVDFLPNQLPNWTASYRSDSTIVTPYGRYVSSSLMDKYQLRKLAFATTSRKNLADGKTKMVAWFVSNCQSSNERRRYVDELSRYVKVSIGDRGS